MYADVDIRAAEASVTPLAADLEADLDVAAEVADLEVPDGDDVVGGAGRPLYGWIDNHAEPRLAADELSADLEAPDDEADLDVPGEVADLVVPDGDEVVGGAGRPLYGWLDNHAEPRLEADELSADLPVPAEEADLDVAAAEVADLEVPDGDDVVGGAARPLYGWEDNHAEPRLDARELSADLETPGEEADFDVPGEEADLEVPDGDDVVGGAGPLYGWDNHAEPRLEADELPAG